MIGKLFRGLLRGDRPNRLSHRKIQHARRARLELLESRHLLSITLPTIAAQTVTADAPLNIALNGSDAGDAKGDPITYTVKVSNSALQRRRLYGQRRQRESESEDDRLRPGRRHQREHDLPVVQQLRLHRRRRGQVVRQREQQRNDVHAHPEFDEWAAAAAVQGTLAPAMGTNFDDDYSPNLQFTGAGMLAIANGGPDTNNTGFFISTAAERYYDFRYTIIGFLTSETGDLLQQISNVKTQNNSKNEDSQPVNTVSITSVTMVTTDNQNGVLQLSAPAGTSGTATVTVTATDGVSGESSSQSFDATILPDTNVDPPYLQRPISPITLAANSSKTFQIPGTITSSGTISYIASMSPANANLTLTPVNDSGEWTLTAANGNAAVGVYTMDVSVQLANPSSTEISSADMQAVPVYISPWRRRRSRSCRLPASRARSRT